MKLSLQAVLIAALAFLTLSACESLRVSMPQATHLPESLRTQPARFVVVTVVNRVQPVLVRAGATPRGYEGASPYGPSSPARAAVRSLERDYKLRQVTAWPIASLGVHCIVFEIPRDATASHVVTQLAEDPRVESVQLLNEFEVQAPPSAASDSHPQTYKDLQRSLEALGVDDAHELSRGAGVRVAIIDTGVDYRHPDLLGRVAMRRNFVDQDDRLFALDVHGTQVAGVIAANADNHQGIVGIAPDARLLVFKSCWHSASGGRARCNSFTLAQALETALSVGADIVNMSLSGPADPLLTRLVRKGIERGILFVAAIAPPGVKAGFPAEISGVLPVCSAEEGRHGARALLALGHEILTLAPGGRYDFASGNSFAAAQVSGTLALVLAARRGMDAQQAYRLLSETSRRVASTEDELISVNACAALAGALNRSTCRTKAIALSEKR